MKPQEIIEYINSNEIKNIIIDCDAGADGDDQFALAYALASPDKVNVIAVNSAPFNENSAETVSAGKAECDEIISVAELDIAAFCGSDDYITRRGKPVISEASENIRRCVLSSETPVFAVITGCCTNIASALALYPEIRDKLIVVWLALDDLEGNSNTGEYNYHNDIEAGRLLFSLAENLVLVCAGRVVAPFRKEDDEIDRILSSSNPLASWLRNRFHEIPWACGLWDLCAEGLLIKADACGMKVSSRPVFGKDGEIASFDDVKKIVVVDRNDPEAIITDCASRINNYMRTLA
ncbi:MAG: nucleoside hydrolase [Clostridia bacterium]|nr:nucleoside hydrolase [Clostridia bacterium]